MSCVHSCEQSNAVDDAAAVWKWKELEIGNIILVQHKVKSIVKISKYQNIIVCSLNYNVMYCMHRRKRKMRGQASHLLHLLSSQSGFNEAVCTKISSFRSIESHKVSCTEGTTVQNYYFLLFTFYLTNYIFLLVSATVMHIIYIGTCTILLFYYTNYAYSVCITVCIKYIYIYIYI